MSSGVRIISSEIISLPPLPETPPPIKLSFFDAFWISFKPVQKVLIYSNFNENVSFSSILEALKSSISTVLIDFLPLAGKLSYVPDTSDVEIDLSDLNFTFIQAESDLDVHQLSTNEVVDVESFSVDVESFSKLVPDIDVSVLPFHVLAVQITRFKSGGVAIGYSIHHMVADGNATTKFMAAWSTLCKAKMHGINLPNELHGSTTYDRSIIYHPKGEQIKRTLLRTSAPNLPSTNHPRITAMIEKRNKLSRRTFTISAQSIQYLKQQGTPEKYNGSKTQVPSTFSAISAHVWACVVRSKSFDPNEEMVFAITMDCRTRLDPPIPDGFIGNCICGVLSRTMVKDLIGEDGLVLACKAIREAINEVAKDPLGDIEEWADMHKNLPFGRLVNASSSPKFRVYDYDFGWGRPNRFEMVSMNSDGEVAFVAGKEEGTVQITISINPDYLELFSDYFLKGLSG